MVPPIGVWKLTQKGITEIHVQDSSSLDAITRSLPTGYYSTFRTYDNCTRAIGLSAHLRRLPDVDASSLRRQLIPSLDPFRPDEARVRVVQTYKGQVYIAIEPLKPLPRDVYEKGVRVETTTIHRDSPRQKSTVFIAASEAERKHLVREGIFEALLVKNGKILEGMTSNFFYIRAPGIAPGLRERSEERLSRRAQPKDVSAGDSASTAGLRLALSPSAQRGIVYTAQRDILLGVTRTMVIRAARGRGGKVRYRALGLSQLPAVTEAFITSSSRGVVPVVQIDDVRVGQGRPGDITRMLMSAYEGYVMKHAEKI